LLDRDFISINLLINSKVAKKRGEKMSCLIQERLDEGRIALFKLNRPHAMNAINTELGLTLNDVLSEISEDKSVRVIVITGEGEKAFCAGGDLKERNGMTEEQWIKQHKIFQEVYRKIRTSSRPVITAVNGYALGGGCEMALSGDLIFASDNAKFGLPEVKRGIIPGVGGTQTIARFLPRTHALKLLLTGGYISAEEAYRLGMLNEVVERDHLVEAALETAKAISCNSPLAVRMAKKALRMGIDMPLEEGVSFALECYNRTINHPDRIEGVKAFNEKRKPEFIDII
jgi:enoyl-CoA hydratase